MKYTLFSGDSLSTVDMNQMRDLYDDLMLLRFRIIGTMTYDTIVVSKSSLRKWVKKEIRYGNDIHKLQVATAYCEDGSTRRDFVLSMRVWRESILPTSKKLTSLYNDTTDNSATIYRDSQLKELKDDLPCLLQQIKYWVADLLEMKTNGRNKRLRERIEMMSPTGDDPTYFSPFSFQSGEAQFVRSQMLPCGRTCGQAWIDVLEKVLAARMIPCTSHHLAPVIMEAFNLKHNFHLNPQFKIEKSEW
eukprot:CAMPEP_0119013998 /NCGR_PEP_ID=MMETSP1176-20130426/9299_1 /TAXON_ID=265551 /ORGANISM="Synedropsis recta cf, Strain CCMP1620" /LENGTH=245 /DNA_ID=CAMNT_0006967131 /DNA_START=139 /DNA_END=873 /DNA_ORIENTATION=+